MSKFKLEFTLKQHTPLIHFQYNQSGATLRATELKPKLDKFLVKYAFDNDFEKYKNLLIGYDGKQKKPSEKDSFDYKVKIIPPKNIKIEDITPPKLNKKTGEIKKDKNGKILRNTYPNFFANMGDDVTNYKKTVMSNEIFNIEITSFSVYLLEKIEDYFAKFLLKTNFGTRQSKGFGSFYLDSLDDRYVKPKAKYKFTINSLDIKNLFYNIELFYKTLRSGINLKNREHETVFYFKSMMFLYAKSKGIQWEKKSIKEKYFNTQLLEQSTLHKNPDVLAFFSKDKKLMKDLLGFSSNESWKYPYYENVSKEHVKGEIDRFKSPITFKPFKNSKGYDVYVFTEKINPNFLDQLFHIKTDSSSGLHLKTPNFFDVDDFIDFSLKVDLMKHVDTRFHNTREFEIIKRIYSNIKSNLGVQNAN